MYPGRSCTRAPSRNLGIRYAYQHSGSQKRKQFVSQVPGVKAARTFLATPNITSEKQLGTRNKRTLSKLGRFLYGDFSRQHCSVKRKRGSHGSVLDAKASKGCLKASNRGPERRNIPRATHLCTERSFLP